MVVEGSRVSISWFSSHAQDRGFKSWSSRNIFLLGNAKIRISATLIFSELEWHEVDTLSLGKSTAIDGEVISESFCIIFGKRKAVWWTEIGLTWSLPRIGSIEVDFKWRKSEKNLFTILYYLMMRKTCLIWIRKKAPLWGANIKKYICIKSHISTYE